MKSIVTSVLLLAAAPLSQAAITFTFSPIGNTQVAVTISGSSLLPLTTPSTANLSPFQFNASVISLGNNSNWGLLYAESPTSPGSTSLSDVYGKTTTVTGGLSGLPTKFEFSTASDAAFRMNLLELSNTFLLPTGTTTTDTFSLSGTFNADFSWATPGDVMTRLQTISGVSDTVTFAIIPEPTTALLAALSSLCLLRRKRG